MKNPKLSLLLLTAIAATAVAAPTIEVTAGKFQGNNKIQGSAKIIERNEKRFVEFQWSKKPPTSVSFRLVKKESLAVGSFPKSVDFVNLGSSPKSVGVSKKLDVWLYRSVAAIDSKTNKIIAFVNLRSAQEGKKSSSN